MARQGGSADGEIVIGTNVDMGGMNTGLNRIQKSSNKLAATLSKALSIGSFINFGKSALNAASDLQEVQNIVDVAFGDMSDQVDDFAKGAIEQFGLSELTAKQTAGSFMSMGKSLGITAENAKNMSLQLTALSGDFASFYNISQDYARTALSAVYTGETETLKRYGISLTEASLQEYMNKKGIDAKIDSLDGASKAMLRYNYILEQTNFVSGDFARTSGSWANQVRLLQQSWTQFLITVGTGLKTVLTPVLTVLRNIVAALNTIAKMIGGTIVKIFGISTDAANDSANGYDNVAGAAGDAADAQTAAGNAAKGAAKDAKKSMAAWDDLNVLQKNSDSSGSGSGGSGGGSSASPFTDIEEYKIETNPLEEYIQSFDSLYELGNAISQRLTEALNSIDWPSIYSVADQFGTGLAEFLNGLITPDLFSALGTTISGALNTALHFAFSFADTFDWGNLGLSVATGINSAIGNFDAALFANSVDAWVQGIFEMFITAVGNIDWKQIGSKILEFIQNLDFKTVEIVIGAILINKIGKFLFANNFEGLLGLALKNPLASAFATAFSSALGQNAITKAIRLLGVKATIIGTSIGTKLGTLLAHPLQTLATGITSIITKLGTVGGAVAGLGVIVAGLAVTSQGVIDMWNNGFSLANEAITAIGIAISALGVLILTTIAGIPIAVAALPVAIIAAVTFILVNVATLIHQHWDEIKEWLLGIGTNIKEIFAENTEAFVADIKDKIEIIKQKIDELKQFILTIVEILKSVWEQLKDAVSLLMTQLWTDIKTIWSDLSTWFGEKITAVQLFWETLKTNVGRWMSDLWPNIKNVWSEMKEWFHQRIDSVRQYWEDFKIKVQNILDTLWSGIKTTWQVVKDWFNDTVITPVTEAWDNFKTTVQQKLDDLWSGIQNTWQGVKTWFDETVVNPVKTAFETACSAISTAFDGVWSGIKSGVVGAMNKAISSVESMINNVINKINSFIDGVNEAIEMANELPGIDISTINHFNTVSIPRVPELAKGGVIPPNAPFMAMLGDQKSGTNIEAPLDTIVQAMTQALSTMNLGGSAQNVTLNIDGKTLARLTVPYNLDELNRRGYNVNVLKA